MLQGNWKSWFSFGARKRRVPARKPTYRPAVDALEDRVVPSGTGVISGSVLTDLTGNGRSADDTALAGVPIRLYQDTNHDGKLSSGDCQLATTYSAADGSYQFNRLASGKYFVTESTPTQDVLTAPTAGSYYTINLAANQTAGGNVFDNFAKCNTGVVTNLSYTITDAMLGTYTVSDLRGQTHQGDTVTANFTVVAGAANVVVSLVSYDAPSAGFDANTASQQVIVDIATGSFGPGVHSLTVHLPDNFYQVDFICGPAIDKLGPAGSNIFYHAQDRFFSGDNEGTNAFVPATLSGIVYKDANSTGIYTNTNDVGLAGVTVTLTGTNDLGQAVNMTATTNANGVYTLSGLREGTYTITQTTPPATGFTDETSHEAFAFGGTASPGVIANIKVTNGGVGGNYNLPEVPVAQQTYSIGGTVNEPPGAGTYTVTLTDTTTHATRTFTASATSPYSFTGLAAGDNYTVTVTPPPGFIVTNPLTDLYMNNNLMSNVTNDNFTIKSPV